MDYIAYWAHRRPQQTAVYLNSTTPMSYGELDARINDYLPYVASYPSALTLAVNDPWGTLLLLWASLRMGKQVFLFNTAFKQHAAQLHPSFNRLPCLTVLPSVDKKSTLSSPIQTTTGSIGVFTSGSSGYPKCMSHPPAHFLLSAKAVTQRTHFKQADVWGLCLPLFHVAGLAVLFRCFYKGAAVALLDSQLSAELLAVCTHVSCVPKQVNSLLKQDPQHTARLRCVMVGGQSLSLALQTAALARQLPIYVSYGLSECASTVALSRLRQPRSLPRLRVLPHCTLMRTRSGCLGITSASCATAYTLTPATLKPIAQPFVTADLVRLSPTGCVVSIVGRQDTILIVQGENIPCEQIEAFICETIGLSHCVLVSVERHHKDAVCLFVPGTEWSPAVQRTLVHSLKEAYSSLLVPAYIFSLPANQDVGMKLSRKQLAQQVCCYLKQEPNWLVLL